MPSYEALAFQGAYSFVHLDHGFASQLDKRSAVAAVRFQKKELDFAGLFVNEEKSH